MMPTDDNYFDELSSWLSHGNYDEVNSTTINKLSNELNLDSVKSCLTFGPGDGQHEGTSSRNVYRTSVSLSPSSRITSQRNV